MFGGFRFEDLGDFGVIDKEVGNGLVVLPRFVWELVTEGGGDSSADKLGLGGISAQSHVEGVVVYNGVTDARTILSRGGVDSQLGYVLDVEENLKSLENGCLIVVRCVTRRGDKRKEVGKRG